MGVVRMLVVKAQDIAIVGGAAGSVREDGVGLGDEGEVVSGVGVGAICVWVVRFRQCVKGPGKTLEISCRL